MRSSGSEVVRLHWKPSSLKTVRAVLRLRSLRRLVPAFLAFSITEWASWIGLVVYAYSRGGPAEAGIVAGVVFLPSIVVAPAASGFVAILPARPDVGYALITVLTEHRRRRAGTALYRDISRWCADQGLEAIEAQIEEDDEASLEYASRRGFTEIERRGGMVLELAGLDLPASALPAGIEIVTWAERPDLARGIYDVVVEAYPDMPGNAEDEMEPYEDWLAHDMQGSADRPEATFLALAGSEVVGFAKFFLTAAQPSEAFHDTTGVKRAWRGRGVAAALKRAQIAWAKEQGYERLVTGNEMRNEAIRRLNARLGYRQAPGRVLMRGPLLRG